MSRRLCFVIACTLLFVDVLLAQKSQWATSLGDNSGNVEVLFTRRYAQFDDVLIGGRYDGKELKLGTFTLKNNGQWDAFFALMNDQGDVVWATGFGGGGDDAVTDAASDASGNMYLAVTSTSLILTIGGFNMPNQGETDAALVLLSPDFRFSAVTHIGTGGHDEIHSVVVDDAGNKLIGGQIIEAQGPRSTTVFVRKLGHGVSTLWERKSTGSEVRLSRVTVDAAGNCYAAGSLWGALEVEGGPTLDTGQERQGFILKYSAAGEWQRGITDTTFSRINALQAFDAHVYAAGERINYYMGWGWPLADSKILLTKYDATLRTEWTRSCGGSEEMQSMDIVRGMSMDQEGSPYVSGYFFSRRLDFAGDTLGNIWNLNYYYQQAFVLKYDSAGNEIWSRGFGGALNDTGNDVAVIGKDRLFVAGGFESDEIRFDQHLLTNNATTREIYVHLRPPRIGRNIRGFVALLDGATASVPPPVPLAEAELYPHPVDEGLRIRVPAFAGRPAQLRIFSLDGRLLRFEAIPDAGTVHALDVSALQPGMYILRITSAHHNLVQRFVRQ
ncbi:MAG: T9SS type A sorting domain-containing protein [Bacteroidia bacterium]|nr:T9SS type A sorting domain-containing protein [Bacteroidia bacterium]